LHVERQEHADDVPQAGQLQLGHQEDGVGHVQGHQVGRRQPLAQVEDQVAVVDPQQVEHPLDVGRLDDHHVGQLQRVGQQVQAGALVLQQRPLDEVKVELLDVQGQVGQGVVGQDVQGDVAVAQGQVEVGQGDGVARLGGEAGGEVDGQGGAADA